MSAESTKQAVRKMAEGFNARQFDTLAGTVFHPALSYTQNGRAGNLAKWIEDARNCVTSFPDGQLTIESQREADGYVTTQFRFAGTHLGPLGDIPATGKAFNIGIATSSRTENGLIIDHSEEVEEMELMRQLGLMPA